jgi:hypothetical protein
MCFKTSWVPAGAMNCHELVGVYMEAFLKLADAAILAVSMDVP